jgi:hypothetical protein
MTIEKTILSVASKGVLIKTVVIFGSVILTLASTVGALYVKLETAKYNTIIEKQDKAMEFNKKIFHEVRVLKIDVRGTNERLDKVDESIKKGNKKFDVMEKHFKGLQNDFLKIDAGRVNNEIIIYRLEPRPAAVSASFLPSSDMDEGLKKNISLSYK